MATHSSTLAWKIPWTEERGGLQSMGSQRVGLNWATTHQVSKCYPLKKKNAKLSFLYVIVCICLFSFGCAGSLRHTVFSSCGEWGLFSSCSAQAPHCSGFSCCRTSALGCVVFSSCSSQALQRRLNNCGSRAWLLCSMWDFAVSGIKPMSPPLAGGFFTTESPGKPSTLSLLTFGAT